MLALATREARDTAHGVAGKGDEPGAIGAERTSSWEAVARDEDPLLADFEDRYPILTEAALGHDATERRWGIAERVCRVDEGVEVDRHHPPRAEVQERLHCLRRIDVLVSHDLARVHRGDRDQRE